MKSIFKISFILLFIVSQNFSESLNESTKQRMLGQILALEDAIKNDVQVIQQLAGILEKGNKTIDNVRNIEKKISATQDNCDKVESVVSTFNLIPYISSVTKPTSKSLDKLSTSLNNIKKPLAALLISENSLKNIMGNVSTIEYNLTTVLSNLSYVKSKIESNISTPGGADLEVTTEDVLNQVTTLHNDIVKMNQDFNLVAGLGNIYGTIDDQTGAISKSLDQADKQIKKAGEKSEDLDNILKKEYKKDVKIGIGKFSKTLKIRLSVKKILTGDGIEKKVQKFIKPAKEWAEKQLAGVKKKFQEKIMEIIPGADDALAKFNSVKDKLNILNQKENSFAQYSKSVEDSKNMIMSSLTKI